MGKSFYGRGSRVIRVIRWVVGWYVGVLIRRLGCYSEDVMEGRAVRRELEAWGGFCILMLSGMGS